MQKERKDVYQGRKEGNVSRMDEWMEGRKEGRKCIRNGRKEMYQGRKEGRKDVY